MHHLQLTTSSSCSMVIEKRKMPIPEPHDATPTARGRLFSKYSDVITMDVT